MPTTILPGRRARAARPAGAAPARAVTALMAGACYAGLLGLVAAPLLTGLRAERTDLARAPSLAKTPDLTSNPTLAKSSDLDRSPDLTRDTGLAQAGPAPVKAAEAGRGFAVPVDDPLLVNERVYQLLVSQDLETRLAVAQEPRGPLPAAVEPVPVPADAVPLPPAPADRAALAAEPPVAEPARAVAASHPAPEAFVGVWSTSAGACSARPSRAGDLLASIDEAGAWAGTTRCAFRDKRRTADGWSVVARCASPRERWSSRVRLRMDGPRLHWASARGVQTYTRCERRLLTAQAS